MNVIRSRLKALPVIIGSALQQSARGYAVVKKLPIAWERPVEPTCTSKEKSGDGGVDWGVKPEDIINKYRESKELESCDETVKKLLSVQYHPKKELTALQVEKAKSMVQKHKYDGSSIEVMFSRLTVRILQFQEREKTNPYDRRAKVVLKELIERRQKLLKKLREKDYPCFEYILERFNLTFHPGIRPEDYHRVERKSGTKRLLRKYCDEMRQKKLDDYKAELQAQHKSFFAKKAEQLEFIRKEEIECGVEPTITEEEIAAAKQKALSYV